MPNAKKETNTKETKTTVKATKPKTDKKEVETKKANTVDKKDTTKKTTETKETTKDLLAKHAKVDLKARNTGEHKGLLHLHEETKEEKEDREIKDELLGRKIEVHKDVKESWHSRNAVINGFKFLGKSFATQWKTLISVTIIFLTVIVVLATLTYGIQFTTSEGFHIPNIIVDSDGTLTEGYEVEYLTYFESLWWVFITISTVGFGDVYPLSNAMRAWAMFIGIVGVVFVSLFTAVVVNGFAIEMQKNLEKRKARIHKYKDKKDKGLIMKRMKLEMDEKDLEIEELKWALAKMTGESQETIEEAMDHAREHAIEAAQYKKKRKASKSKSKTTKTKK